MANLPPGGATLNWKVNEPVPVSVPVAVHLIVLPIFCGDASDGVRETTDTAANACALHTANPSRHNKPLVHTLMENCSCVARNLRQQRLKQRYTARNRLVKPGNAWRCGERALA